MHLPAYLAPFRPRILLALRGYTRERFTKDLGAGMTVGIVAPAAGHGLCNCQRPFPASRHLDGFHISFDNWHSIDGP